MIEKTQFQIIAVLVWFLFVCCCCCFVNLTQLRVILGRGNPDWSMGNLWVIFLRMAHMEKPSSLVGSATCGKVVLSCIIG